MKIINGDEKTRTGDFVKLKEDFIKADTIEKAANAAFLL